MAMTKMTEVIWPMGSLIDDCEVCDWLQALVDLSPETLTFELYDHYTLRFAREDDAIAFKLRFCL
jgi:hypothetical protein